MSYFLHVLCRDGDTRITASEIEEFILEGVYFDEPKFQVEREQADDSGWDWRRITVIYEPLKRPITIENDNLATAQTGELDELREVLQGVEAGAAVELRHHLDATKRVITFHVDQAGLTEDGWLMLDCLESFIAKRCDGIVYAPDDGFYDSALKLLATARAV